MGYKSSAFRGISWMYGFRVISRSISFLKLAVLARVLSPAQFGIFGIASLILTFLEILTQTGINVILIQSKKEISEYLDSAWVVSILRGVIISLSIIFSAPFIASFFNSPEAINILLLISLVPFIRGFINPAEIQFQKDLKFNYEFWFRTSIFFIDALVSIILSITTHSVYSLVIGLIAGCLFECIISFVLIKPTPRLKINLDYVKELFHKGKWITAYGIMSYFGDNGDNILVGRLLGASPLGIYQMAYRISTLPISEVSDVVSQVVFPVYTKIEGDRQRLIVAFSKTTLVISVITICIGTIIFLFPSQIISIILGKQWLSAVPVLKVLSVYGILRAISGPASVLFLAVEKQSYVTAMTFTRGITLLITIIPLITMFGLIGAGYSALLSVLVEIPIILFLVVRVLRDK